MSTSNVLIFFVNGRKITVPNPDPEMTLLHFLRYKHYAVNSCLAPLCAVHGIAVTTVEGVGSLKTKLHPIQRNVAENHGSQCGFCTPGIIMSVYAMLRSNPSPTQTQLYDALDGNLCRCTGYRPILDGLYPFTKEFSCPMGEKCCRNMNGPSTSNGAITVNGTNGHVEENGFSQDIDEEPAGLLYDPSQEPIFPPELKLLSPKLIMENLQFETERCVWLRPVNLEQLLEIKTKYPECKIVTGNTEIGIETKFKQRHYRVLVSPAFVKELRDVVISDKGLRFGASVTLTDMEKHLRKAVDTFPEETTRVFTAFIEMLGYFAGRQIRNVASLGGNIINASPISDLNVLLLACSAEIEFVAKEHGYRTVKMDTDFFRGYKKTRMRDNEILVFVTLPFTKENQYIFGYKQAGRKEDDISIVNAGMWVDLADTGTHIRDITLAFGGMSVSTVLASKTMDALKGVKWDESVVEIACATDMLPADLYLAPGSPGGMVAYRRTLTLSFFFRFYTAVTCQMQKKTIMDNLPSAVVSAKEPIRRGLSRGSQFYSTQKNVSAADTIGRPLVHRAAIAQCTGEAVYLDDLPVGEGELFLGLVTSKRAHAYLVKVDLSPALSMPGVVDAVDYRDVPKDNEWDKLEQVFAREKVTHEGQVIAAVVARTLVEAQRAAQCVDVVYEDLEPVVTIQQAIDKHLSYSTSARVKRGDVDSAFSMCDLVVEGNAHVSAQEHFYLEPQGCVVYPRDFGELEVIATTQSPTQMQKALIKVLGYSANCITVKVKRLGGGFGGKETRTAGIVLPSAIAAVNLWLSKFYIQGSKWSGIKYDFLLVEGPAEAYEFDWHRDFWFNALEIGFNKNGKILAVSADLYLNMGHSTDLSPAVLETAILDIDSAYNIENFWVRGHLCPTNLTSCTAFRGFGGPQAIIMAESWISHVADTLGMSQEEVREKNFYKEGDYTPIGQLLSNCNISNCWTECLKNSNFVQRKHAVEQFNKENRWKKRGLAVTPLKYGLAFLLQSMNQGGALVHIYTDGSVLVAHGGIEMGQGLHTKMIQVVSRELDVTVSCIHIGETSTASVPNTGPTAASMSSDLYGAALIDACKTLKERLATYRKAAPDKTLKEWAIAAHQDRISLSVVGFYKLEDVSLDWSKDTNSPFSYFSFGAACSEVEIDCLTGDHQVMRTDIVMDVGQSLNPAIDIGQIEGAFIQGYGLVMLEDYKVSPEGVHLSRGPGSYKIPSFANIPEVLNVSLLRNSRNPRALYSSKGVGEPPLCLATSVLMATRNAIMAARLDAGYSGHFQLDSPATPEKIRMACMDRFAQQASLRIVPDNTKILGDYDMAQFFEDDLKDKEKPWSVKL